MHNGEYFYLQVKGMFIPETFLSVINHNTAQQSVAYKVIVAVMYIGALIFNYQVWMSCGLNIGYGDSTNNSYIVFFQSLIIWNISKNDKISNEA